MKRELLVASCRKKWLKTWDLIQKMRSNRDAPVDTMGCERLGLSVDSDDKATQRIARFQVLVGLMLSSQTKDEITAAAFHRLVELCAGKMEEKSGKNASYLSQFRPDRLVQFSETEISKAIYPVGFHNRKAKYLRETCQILMSEYEGDIPRTLEGLVKLPGVGPKMAYLALNVGWQEATGIGVDVYVHRIAERLGWTMGKTAKTKNYTPESTRIELESFIPSSYWVELNPLLVGFGQTVCRPVKPLCDTCLVGQAGQCPSYKPTVKKEDDEDKSSRPKRQKTIKE